MSKLFESKRIVIATIGSLGDLSPLSCFSTRAHALSEDASSRAEWDLYLGELCSLEGFCFSLS
jgi:hypothetical protein